MFESPRRENLGTGEAINCAIVITAWEVIDESREREERHRLKRERGTTLERKERNRQPATAQKRGATSTEDIDSQQKEERSYNIRKRVRRRKEEKRGTDKQAGQKERNDVYRRHEDPERQENSFFVTNKCLF